MAFSPTDSNLFGPLFGDAELSVLFSDERFVEIMVEVEVALAEAQGRLGVIPEDAASRIVEATTTFRVDFEALKMGTEKAGVPVKELVRQLRLAVGGDAAKYVHWGATTQDIIDTALVLQLRAALLELERKLLGVVKELGGLAESHRLTLMAGRTHSQQALPITFGLKAAGWMAPLLRHRQRLKELKPRLYVVQLGGAAGTLASLGDQGIAVQQELAKRLDLALPLLPWHTGRDALVEAAGWFSLVSGSLAKMAQDVILLAQSEVDEVRESADRSRGGSSTMPQKSNPIVSELIIAAARTNASLLSALHNAQIQEHERATHGWQMEWLVLPQMVALTATALNKALFVTGGMVVNADRMKRNVAESNGLMQAEAARMALLEHMDAPAADQLVNEAVQTAISEDRHLIEVLRDATEAPLDWVTLKDETSYFGSADVFIARVLAEARKALDE